ncbi:MAG: haloacid dehalogenase-like hydrolase [Eubacterium sp.]|nr:haloacid dehalogenase-like hydrolase [Eubacterium sp.]
MKKRIVSTVLLTTLVIGGLAPAKTATMAGIRLNKTSVKLEVGKSVTLKVKGTKKKVTWTSSKPKIAKVNKSGKVTAKKAGSAVIKAKVAKKTLKCKVKVTSAAKAAPLGTYWSKDSEAAASLREYVSTVTNEKDPGYIPAEDRIAVFDMDGTLMCETYFTYYDTMMFIDFCLKDHPERVEADTVEAAKAIHPGYKADIALARQFAKAYKGMTVDELYDYVVSFGEKYTDSFNNMRYKDGFYLPMVELVKYLYDNDFKVYVVSGTEVTTTRAIVANSPIAKYVPSERVIGSEFETETNGNLDAGFDNGYVYQKGDSFVFTGNFIQKNLNIRKPINIMRNIGKQPVLAFGNSSTDSSMMDHCIDGNVYKAAAYMVVADDETREWGKESNWTDKTPGYIEKGYVPVSMKNDFAQIYPEGITKAETQEKTEETVPAAA